LYWQVLNAKKHGIPQNRERVFLVGIRDDVDNKFQFPKEEHLSKRLKDLLEKNVDDKYFVTEEKIKYLLRTEGTTFDVNAKILENDLPNESRTIQSGYYKSGRDCQFVKVKSATQKGYEEATLGDSINFSVLKSETRRGRVGKGVAQTLDTYCNQATMQSKGIRRLTPRECFRLMDFPDSFTWPVSDSQAYKQAGNSIVVNVLYKILNQLPL
jgi:DNA (cytosine-5)-methyltransferase 1